MASESVAEKLRRLGLYEEVMWHERYDEDHPGHHATEQARLEKEDLPTIFARWCRGQNLVNYSYLILRRVDQFKEIFKEGQ